MVALAKLLCSSNTRELLRSTMLIRRQANLLTWCTYMSCFRSDNNVEKDVEDIVVERQQDYNNTNVAIGYSFWIVRQGNVVLIENAMSAHSSDKPHLRITTIQQFGAALHAFCHSLTYFNTTYTYWWYVNNQEYYPAFVFPFFTLVFFSFPFLILSHRSP